jgi:hypothetical protein
VDRDAFERVEVRRNGGLGGAGGDEYEQGPYTERARTKSSSYLGETGKKNRSEGVIATG